jgi:hypothetical protein
MLLQARDRRDEGVRGACESDEKAMRAGRRAVWEGHAPLHSANASKTCPELADDTRQLIRLAQHRQVP